MSLDYRRQFIEAQDSAWTVFKTRRSTRWTRASTYWSAHPRIGQDAHRQLRDRSDTRAGTASLLHHTLEALSNQKYAELCDLYGDERVGC